ncbi:hypothetical protein DDQ41_27095 [Streptomyces spongiicola]|uniref:Uncharacterized protein n=1 Tax=Streptomyces spongiicola TaxID=1690221 RepID=A0ABM6VC75_9ACTN|nr:hypothetical protein DDQ41_27095 [Streptomyces spongiicola]
MVLLTAGSAGADSYDQRMTSVGPGGASTAYVSTGTTVGGGSYYSAGESMAGPDGAMSSRTQSSAGGVRGASGYQGGLLGLGRLLG